MKNNLQDKFDDFGSIPSNDVWAEIERQLNQKKKRRALIFWFSSGLAACFLGIILLLNFNRNEKTLAVKSKNTNLTSSKKEITLQENEVSKDTLLAKKQTLTESKLPENKKVNKKSNSKRKTLRTKSENTNQENISIKLTELSHQFEEKNKDFYKADSSNLVQKGIEKKDSLKTKDSLNLNENNVTNVQNLIKIDSSYKRKTWSLEFGLTTWDAFKNEDQYVKTGTLAQNNTSSFLIAESNSGPNTSIVSIYKPLSLNLMLNYTSKKNLILSAGFNLDVMKLKENELVSKYTSLGLSYALGYQFKLSPKISFVPQVKNNYDFYTYTSSSSIGKDYSLFSFSDKFSGFQNSLQLDLKFKYTIDRHSMLCISPTNRYYLQQSFRNIKLLERKYWYGIQFSYQYNF